MSWRLVLAVLLSPVVALALRLLQAEEAIEFHYDAAGQPMWDRQATLARIQAQYEQQTNYLDACHQEACTTRRN